MSSCSAFSACKSILYLAHTGMILEIKWTQCTLHYSTCDTERSQFLGRFDLLKAFFQYLLSKNDVRHLKQVWQTGKRTLLLTSGLLNSEGGLLCWSWGHVWRENREQHGLSYWQWTKRTGKAASNGFCSSKMNRNLKNLNWARNVMLVHIYMHTGYPYVICTYLDTNAHKKTICKYFDNWSIFLVIFQAELPKHHFISWTVDQTKQAI